MRLNVQTDYALRMLMHLAVEKQGLVSVREVSERFGISKNHLMKVAYLLGRAGFIEAVRGRAGGLRLGCAATDINVGEVVRCVEADFAIVECFQNDKGECLITPACRLKGVLQDATAAFLAVLDDYSIDDLVRRHPTLRSLLIEGAV